MGLGSMEGMGADEVGLESLHMAHCSDCSDCIWFLLS